MCENFKLKKILNKKNYYIQSLKFKKIELKDELNFCDSEKK